MNALTTASPPALLALIGGNEDRLTPGIVLRAQLSPQNKVRYGCTWTPKSGVLELQLLGIGSPTILATTTAPNPAAQPTSFTMEASIKGTTLSCCIREIEGAGLVNAIDATNAAPMGYPGLTTTRMAAAFSSFVVLKTN